MFFSLPRNNRPCKYYRIWAKREKAQNKDRVMKAGKHNLGGPLLLPNDLLQGDCKTEKPPASLVNCVHSSTLAHPSEVEHNSLTSMQRLENVKIYCIRLCGGRNFPPPSY